MYTTLPIFNGLLFIYSNGYCWYPDSRIRTRFYVDNGLLQYLHGTKYDNVFKRRRNNPYVRLPALEP